MTRRLATTAALAALILAGGRLAAQAPLDDRPLDPKVLAWDRGPDKIDVSKYPPDMKGKYKTMTEVCAKCHTLARIVNCDFVLEDEWERYIKKMMRRSGRMIAPDDAQQIFEFLLYDAKVRKTALYQTKLAASR